MNTPTPEQIAKLPAWARELIASQSRQLTEALKMMHDFQSGQEKSPFYLQKFRGAAEPEIFYIQTNRVYVHHRGIKLEVATYDGGLNGKGIRIKWEGEGSSEAALIPDCHQSAMLVSKEDMR